MSRHAADVVSLVFGVVFVALGLVGIVDTLSVSLADIRWLLPGLLIVFGLVLVITSGRDRGDAPATGHDTPGTEVVRPDDPR